MAKSKKPSLKAETLKMTGWTEAEYRRRYDIFRRKTAKPARRPEPTCRRKPSEAVF